MRRFPSSSRTTGSPSMPGSNVSRVVMVVIAAIVVVGLILSTMAVPLIGR